jgi:hypothetical protein
VVEVDLVEIPIVVLLVVVVLVVEVEVVLLVLEMLLVHRTRQLHQFRDMLVEMALQALVLRHLVEAVVVPVVLVRLQGHHHQHKEQKVV